MHRVLAPGLQKKKTVITVKQKGSHERSRYLPLNQRLVMHTDCLPYTAFLIPFKSVNQACKMQHYSASHKKRSIPGEDLAQDEAVHLGHSKCHHKGNKHYLLLRPLHSAVAPVVHKL